MIFCWESYQLNHSWCHELIFLPKPQIYEAHSISFQTFFVQTSRIVVDSWKFTMLLLYILSDDWPIFMISGLNEQLQQQLECSIIKPDCHSWWISKMQSGREDTLEERYAIKLCFKLGKNARETHGMLQTAFRPSCMNRAWDFEWHKRFKEGSVSGISTRTMHQFTTPSLSQTIWPRLASRHFLSLPIVQTLLPGTFGYSLSSEVVVMRQLRRWKRPWRRSLTRSQKRTSMGPSRSWLNGTSALQPEEITSKETRVSCV